MINFRIAAATIALSGAALLGGCATLEEGAAELVAETRHATLTGQQVVGRGDPDGYAKAELTVTDELNQVCYDVNNVRNLGTVTSIRIHRGAPGATGPAVLNLSQAREGGWKNCVGRAEWTEDRLESNPAAYYIQINTSDYPNGAIRGQFAWN